MTTTATAAPAKHSAPNSAGAKAAAPEYNPALSVAAIVPDPKNRKEHELEDLQELLDMIKAEGLLQPIVVRPIPKWPKAFVGGSQFKTEAGKVWRVFAQVLPCTDEHMLYETADKKDAERAAALYRSGEGWQLIAGERRWRAHLLGKLATIRAFIHRGETDVSSVFKQVVENLGRKDLDPIEEARQMKRLEDLKVPQKEIGKLFGGRSQPVVANTLKMLKLPADVQRLVIERKLTAAHGQELVRFADWPKVCSLIAQEVVGYEKNNDETYSAKRLRDEELPFDSEIHDAKLGVEIYVGNYSYDSRPQYKLPAELSKQPGFIKSGYDSWTYLLPNDSRSPNLWAPEQARQDKAREAAKAAKTTKNEQAKKAGKPTQEQKERKAKLDKNKARRAAVDATLALGLRDLKEHKGLNTKALAVICDMVLGDREAISIEQVAAGLGIKVPSKLVNGNTGFGESNSILLALGAEQMIKLAAASIMLSEAEPARKFASEVPESCNFIAGKAAAKASSSAVQVKVRRKGNDYFAKAGEATASSTSSFEAAAKTAAAKYLSCKDAQVDLLRMDMVDEDEDDQATDTAVFTATKGGK